MLNQKHGAHGLVGENARASAQGALGMAERTSTSLQHQAPGDHHLGGAAARVPHMAAASTRPANMDALVTLKNPNLGLFEVVSDPNSQRDAAADLLPIVHAQLGNKTSKTGNGSHLPKKSNLGTSLGPDAAKSNSGNHGLGNLTAGPSFVQILNSGHNASNVKGVDQDATIAPESSKPSLKDLGVENPNLGETSSMGKKLWADVADEALVVENRLEDPNKEGEILLHDESQLISSMHINNRDSIKENEQDHTNMNAPTNVVSVDDSEDNRDPHPQPVAIG
ncbi:hypothetical protein TorRG33x02_353720, partial [Trema orientale]